MPEGQPSNLKTLPACIQSPQIFWQWICNEECLKKKAKCRKTLQNKTENVKYVQNMSFCIRYLFWQYHSSLYLLCQGENNQCYLEHCYAPEAAYHTVSLKGLQMAACQRTVFRSHLGKLGNSGNFRLS